MLAKVPAAHGEHTLSAVAEAGVVYIEPGLHVADCAWHPLATGSANVDEVDVAEKLPAPHGVQTRSLVGVAGAEKNLK